MRKMTTTQIFPSSVQRYESISNVPYILDNDLHTTQNAQFPRVNVPIICPVPLEYILTLSCSVIVW
jgi:hypothetical protein